MDAWTLTAWLTIAGTGGLAVYAGWLYHHRSPARGRSRGQTTGGPMFESMLLIVFIAGTLVAYGLLDPPQSGVWKTSLYIAASGLLSLTAIMTIATSLEILGHVHAFASEYLHRGDG